MKVRWGTVEGLVGLLLVCAGVAVFCWPAALIVAGGLLLVDVVT